MKYPQKARFGEQNGMYGLTGLQPWHNISGIGKGFHGKHSEKTKKKISEAKKGKAIKSRGIPRPQIRGENHSCWKGGIARDYDRVRNIEWATWRKAVFKRDNYTCQVCGKKNCELHPHHLIQVRELLKKNESKIYDINNGLTLCIDCHKKVHYGKEAIFPGRL